MLKKGIVYCSTGSNYRIKSEGQFYDCRIKGKFRIKDIKSTNPVAVGDKVSFTIEPKKEFKGVITAIETRQNYIVRKSVNLSKQTHIIAANIDQAILMITLDSPITTTGFIDRFLVAANAYDVAVVLLFNKTDLLNEGQKFEQENLRKVYEKIGYQCFAFSVTVSYTHLTLPTKA